MHLRVKDIIGESHMVNEAQVMDASPQFQQLSDSISSVSSAIGSAIGEVSQVASAAKSALDAISDATQAAQSIGVDSNAVIDNINAAQEADPSQSVITLSDHHSGVQQAYNILSTIVSALNTAQGLCGKLNNLAARQFL